MTGRGPDGTERAMPFRPVPLLLTLLAAPALAQQSPPPGPLRPPVAQGRQGVPGQPARPQPAQSPGTAPPQAAPRTPVQRAAPTVQPRPGPAGQPAHRPPSRPPTTNRTVARPPQPRPPAPPAAAPVPAPVPEPAAPAEPAKGSNTGLPLPRFAALRSDDVNLRTGPGTRYPIDWVYKRRDLPVSIEREFEVWRLVRDQEGVKGWVHSATLTGRRTAVVAGAERTLRASAQLDASPVARLKPGVIVRVRSCEAAAEWCQVNVGDYRGWLRRDEVWGILPGEAVQ